MKTVFVKAPFQFKIKEIPIPQPAAGEVLLRVKACGICGSDLHIARSQAADWVTFGHEMTGVIEQTGPGVRHVWPGQRVAVESGSIDKPLSNRMASTIRHNRARGSHDVDRSDRPWSG